MLLVWPKLAQGKTIAFLLPLFRHIKDQRPLEQMEGPINGDYDPNSRISGANSSECKPFLKVLGLKVWFHHFENSIFSDFPLGSVCIRRIPY